MHGSSDLENSQRHHPYLTPESRATSPATADGQRDPLGFFATPGSNQGSRETSLQIRVFGDASEVPPPPQPPTPLVPIVFDATNDLTQQMAILCSVPLTDADDTRMYVDNNAGGEHRHSAPTSNAQQRGLSPSPAATAAAFAPPQSESLAGTGLPAVPLEVQECEKLRFQNQQLTMQIEAMKAVIEAKNAAADDKDNEVKRYRYDAQLTMAESEAREQALRGEASQTLSSVQAEAVQARQIAQEEERRRYLSEQAMQQQLGQASQALDTAQREAFEARRSLTKKN